MNYLAHIFLSGLDSHVQIGNFIGDFVKGNQYEIYPERIRKGILLHRKIDSYTDSHPVVRETVTMLRPAFGRYSAIVADMYFDYFLANSFRDYHSEKSLRFFALRFYVAVLLNYKHLPVKVKGFIFHFVLTGRLTRYASPEGLRESLRIMSRHKVSALEPDKTIAFLLDNHSELQQKFHLFFPDLVRFVKSNV